MKLPSANLPPGFHSLYFKTVTCRTAESNWQENLNILVKDLFPKSMKNINRLFTLIYNYPQFNQGQLGNAVSCVGKIQDKQTGEIRVVRII
jgi:hypothetical protein